MRFKGLLHKFDQSLYNMFDPPTQHCDGCDNEYPSYFLTHRYGEDYCNTCLKIGAYSMKYCEGCGGDFPKSHVSYVDIWDGYFCESCQE